MEAGDLMAVGATLKAMRTLLQEGSLRVWPAFSVGAAMAPSPQRPKRPDGNYRLRIPSFVTSTFQGR